MRNQYGKNNPFYKHGMRRTRFYSIFFGVFDRCNNPASLSYPKYGGRGIKCIWKSFIEFRDDMHKSYLNHVKKFGESETTINRIDNNENYSAKNCAWSTYKEQARNTRTNHLITFNGKTQCIADWAEELGISRGSLSTRIYNRWSIKRALTTPKMKNQFI